MRLLIVSDVHDISGFRNVYRLLELESPDGVLSCGDWGDYYGEYREHVLRHYTREFLSLDSSAFRGLFNPILSKGFLYTLYGNHDAISDLKELHNSDGSPCLLPTMTTVMIGETSLVGISGNFAKQPRREGHITEEKTRREYEEWRAKNPTVDIVLSHEAVASDVDYDMGQPILKEMCDDLKPRYWFSGHIHKASKTVTPTGTTIVNTGITLYGDYAVLDTVTMTLTTGRMPADAQSTARELNEKPPPDAP